MTEKRFTLTDERKCYFIPLIVDNQINKKLGISKAMEYLNALHEENEQLTKEIEDLKEERDYYKGHCESEGLLYD